MSKHTLTSLATSIEALTNRIADLETQLQALRTQAAAAQTAAPQQPEFEAAPFVGQCYRTRPDGTKEHRTESFDSLEALREWAKTAAMQWTFVYCNKRGDSGQLEGWFAKSTKGKWQLRAGTTAQSSAATLPPAPPPQEQMEQLPEHYRF
jgi:hypothetical protein